jgi:cytochrome o ubiquinol oxidase operon protein cyoD
MGHDLSLKEIQKEWHGTVKSYMIGFLASLLLTGASFLLVISKLLSGHLLVYSLIGLAVVQAIVQVLFFLHVGQEAKPRWETIAFRFTVLFVLIVLIGTLWVMHDLDERVMSGMNMDKEMSHD